ncbi:MAG TPA: SURF1 family protein [Anaerolineales bacterium]|nr:SURF1 family protein [Anaerolineales bacterium]
MILKLFSRSWILTTLLVLVGVGVLVRLGIWQLDRLDARRAFNARVLAQEAAPMLVLDQGALTEPGLAESLTGMEYRAVTVQGEYDFSHQVALRNQSWGNEWGVHLLTPLRITGSDQSILVDRGWIPAEAFKSGEWSQYAEPGMVSVKGILRASQSKPDYGKKNDPEGTLQAWNFANVERIQNQTPYPLLPVYIQQAPDPAWTAMPYRSLPELELTEGPHMGYALQWFAFSAILGVGYPFFVRKQSGAKHANP